MADCRDYCAQTLQCGDYRQLLTLVRLNHYKKELPQRTYIDVHATCVFSPDWQVSHQDRT